MHNAVFVCFYLEETTTTLKTKFKNRVGSISIVKETFQSKLLLEPQPEL